MERYKLMHDMENECESTPHPVTVTLHKSDYFLVLIFTSLILNIAIERTLLVYVK